MNQPAKRRRSARRAPPRRPASSVDPWLVPAPLPDLEPIRAPGEVTALLQSLGDPPIAQAGHLASYFAAVIERAAAVATALSLSAQLPAVPPDTTCDPSN